MAADPHQVIYCPRDPFFHSILPVHQPHNHVLQNAWIPPAPAIDQPEGHLGDIPPPVQGVAAPARVQDPHHFDVAYQGVVDYHPRPLRNPAYVFPDIGFGQGIPPQAQPNAPGYAFGHVPQQGPPVHADPFVHRVPTPNQGGTENLRRLASRYLHHPDAQVGMVSMEPGAAGRVKVVIILESEAVFL